MTTLPTWLIKAQKKSNDHAHDLPSKVNYGSNIRAFFGHDFPSSNTHTPTFAWHGPQEVLVSPLSEALPQRHYQKYLEKHFSLLQNSTKISAFTNGQCSEGLVIDIPQDHQEERHYSLKISGNDQGFSHGHVIVIARSGSKTTLITEQKGSKTSHYRISIFLESTAELNHIALGNNQENPQFCDHTHYIDEAGKLLYVDTAAQNHHGERNVLTFLQGRYSQAEHHHLCVLNDHAQYDLNTMIAHEAPDTTSFLSTRAVVDDQSHMIYRGQINVGNQASGSNSKQKEATLLLSHSSKMDAIPMLDITNDQVQCSHSASMSNFAPEQLFYMTSRGLTPQQTKQILIKGFIHADLNKIASSKTWLPDSIDQSLSL